MASNSTIKELYGDPALSLTLKVANGGAGPTGIIRALAEAFLAAQSKQAFNIGWVQSISVDSLAHIKNGSAHISLTYDPVLEQQSLGEHSGENYQYVFKDHFLLVGPKDGVQGVYVQPALNARTSDVIGTFKLIVASGVDSKKPIYITRDDNSGTHTKETALWEDLRVDLPKSSSSWYYRMPASQPRFPADCLRLAQEMKCFTLVDRGTFLMDPDAQQNLAIYLQGTDEDNDVLLNPCHALVSCAESPLKSAANEFVNFMVSSAGQSIIRTHGKHHSSNLMGMPFFSPTS